MLRVACVAKRSLLYAPTSTQDPLHDRHRTYSALLCIVNMSRLAFATSMYAAGSVLLRHNVAAAAVFFAIAATSNLAPVD